ncbi:hypothetical protein OC835_005683 [Tilletia horrida]|nr:hypothetical protein OC835_005683 [Tilletia horrida]
MPSYAWMLGSAVSAVAVASAVVIVAAALAIPLLQRRVDALDSKASPSTSTSKISAGFVVPARVYHARFLPKESAHAFRYPALYLALELGALEAKAQTAEHARRSLDIPRLLKYKDPTATSHPWTVSSINPPEYYRSDYTSLKEPVRTRVEASIRLKTLFELRHRNLIKRGPQDVQDDDFTLDEEIGQIWSITMPSLLGVQGINPLTTYFCYRPTADKTRRGELAYVLLEVHNTFTERHLYVLECGVNEDDATPSSDEKAASKQVRRQGCDHQWTFPRTFHVSPFNDRGGYYTCSVKDLMPASTLRPELDIRVTLLIADPEVTASPSAAAADDKEAPLVKKMVAILTSHPSATPDGHPTPLRPLPLTASNLLLALLRQPLDLFLTFARIAYEAGRLHWGKNRLDVFGKPEMDDGSGLEGPAGDFTGVGWPPSLNPTEPNRKSASGIAYSRQKSGALVRSEPSASDAFGQKALEAVIRASAPAPRIVVRINDEDESAAAEMEKADVTLYARSAAIYSDLLLYPAPLAHLIGARIARRWGVSDTQAYLDAFARLGTGTGTGTDPSRSRAARLGRSIRAAHVRWALSVAPASAAAPSLGSGLDPSSTPEGETRRRIEEHLLALSRSAHPFERAFFPSSQLSEWTALAHLLSAHLVARAEELVFRWVRARYVRGLEPWTEVRRGVELLVREEVEGEKGGDGKEARPAWFFVGSARREVEAEK